MWGGGLIDVGPFSETSAPPQSAPPPHPPSQGHDIAHVHSRAEYFDLGANELCGSAPFSQKIKYHFGPRNEW